MSGVTARRKESGLKIRLFHLLKSFHTGSVSGADISKQSIEVLTTLLFKHASEEKILFVFDNVDHYADLELGKMTGSLDRFIEVFLWGKNQIQRYVLPVDRTFNIKMIQFSVSSLRVSI